MISPTEAFVGQQHQHHQHRYRTAGHRTRPPATTTSIAGVGRDSSYTSSLLQRYATTSSSSSTSTSNIVSSLVSGVNPLRKLPWNVQKEKEREARRYHVERVKLHRELGIAEDATYEEIVEATNRLIESAGSDVKQKIRIEVAKDKILQIRLNERLAGLTQMSEDAQKQSKREREGEGEEEEDEIDAMLSKKKKKKGTTSKDDDANTPQWRKGLIVKPDRKRLVQQGRLWSIITAVGVTLPGAQESIGRFTWVVCAGQLIYRGMPEGSMSRGIGYFDDDGGSAPGGKSSGHRKISFGIAFLLWMSSTVVAGVLLPPRLRNTRTVASTFKFLCQNITYFVASIYLHPYKGK